MKSRLITLLVILGLCFSGLVVRLLWLQVEQHAHFLEVAEQQQQRVVRLNPPRGTIFDARGRPLAISGPSDSIFAEPREIAKKVGDPRLVAEPLAEALGLDADELSRRLSGKGWFVWVARQVEPEQAEAVRELNLPGVGFREESKRFYPQGHLAAQVVGFVGTDFSGLAGLEQSFDEEIRGRGGRRVVLRDAGGHTAVDPDLGWAVAVPGADLHLTLDGILQHAAERELAAAIETYDAVAATAVLLDPKTGAVRAMASYPSFNPNRFRDYPDAEERWRNRGLTDVFEPGSVFKMVTAAAALESKRVAIDDIFDCQMGRIQLHGVTIRDHKPFGYLDVRTVMAKSSNIGAIKMGLKAGEERLYAQILALGFGRRTGIELPGESPGLLRAREQWQPATKAYISFGQGIAVTPLQLAAAYAAVANGGTLLKPYLVQSVERDGERIDLHPEPEVVGTAMSPTTAAQLRELLEGVVRQGGTGKRAAVAGYRVAGKTGTAQMVSGGRGYSRTDHMAVFTGFAPGWDPHLVGVIVVDRPRGRYHGGEVAAPVFGAIVSQALLLEGIRPHHQGEDAGVQAAPLVLARSGESASEDTAADGPVRHAVAGGGGQ